MNEPYIMTIGGRTFTMYPDGIPGEIVRAMEAARDLPLYGEPLTAEELVEIVG